GAIEAHLGVERTTAPTRMVDGDGEMVLKIPADARPMHVRRDADLTQMIRLADTRQHEQLRGVEHAAGEQHLACDRGLTELTGPGVLDTRRAVSLENHPGRERVRLH